MTSINIGEADFDLVVTAALAAQQRGDLEQARGLDRLARKINAALANRSAPLRQAGLPGQAQRLSWREVPSVLKS